MDSDLYYVVGRADLGMSSLRGAMLLLRTRCARLCRSKISKCLTGWGLYFFYNSRRCSFLSGHLATLSSIFRSRAALGLENLALRHQIGVLQRSAKKRPKWTSRDRLLWICLSRFWRDWRSALAIVKPETVVAWHRAGFRLFWTWKVRHGQPGRPLIPLEVRDLIRKMCRENPGWGDHASTANCSSSASTSVRAASANTWCAAANRRLRLGAHSWRITPSSSFLSTSLRCPQSVSRSFTCSWCWSMTGVAFCTPM
jgi:hypothetical protein